MKPHQLLPIISAGYKPATLKSILDQVGIGNPAVLQFCLDAADRASWPGSGTKWLDVSGNGTDFFLGSDGSTAANMPTFFGTVGGLSGNDYWSFDGGDFFRYDTTNEAWMASLNQAGASALFLWGARAASAPQRVVGNHGGSTNGVVVSMSASTPDVGIFVRNNNVAQTAISQTQRVVNNGPWTIAALCIREGVTNGSFTFCNGALGAPLSVTYNSPAGSASFTTEIAAGGNGFGPFPSGSRLNFVAAWSGSALPTAQQIAQVYDRISGRFAF